MKSQERRDSSPVDPGPRLSMPGAERYFFACRIVVFCVHSVMRLDAVRVAWSWTWYVVDLHLDNLESIARPP